MSGSNLPSLTSADVGRLGGDSLGEENRAELVMGGLFDDGLRRAAGGELDFEELILDTLLVKLKD